MSGMLHVFLFFIFALTPPLVIFRGSVSAVWDRPCAVRDVEPRTNCPGIDVICRNIRTVREKMATRPDILGCHLEGPFLALKCKGAHDSNCLKDPMPELMDRMLDASGADLAAGKLGCIRQITISTPPTGPPNTSGAPAARWSKLLPAKSTPVPPVFETTSYA